MSSLTSLGVNKNKAKFAPKANRSKVRKRPQADATNNEVSQENSNVIEENPQKQPEASKPVEKTLTKPREPSPPPPPPITQITPSQEKKKSETRTPMIIAEAGSPLTPTPDSPAYEPPSRKETVAKTNKKPSKKSAGTSFSTPSNKGGTAFSAPSRSGGGTSIAIGDRRPKQQDKTKEKTSNFDDDEEEEEKDENGNIIKGRRGKKYKKRKLEDLRPEELKTLEDISHDPSRIEDLDKPMLDFTKDIDGIVSKNFREMERNRYAQREKVEAMKKMSKEEIDKLKKKDEEEEEKKKKQLEKQKEEELKRLEKEKPVLEESSHALQVRIVDGEIVLDMDSLTVERPQGTAAYEEGSMEIVEENSMTRKVNSRTYGKHTQTKRWSVLETEEFFEALAQFGTDFEMIAQILPGRTRNMVRAKYNKEERANPEKITDYLIRKKKPMDLEKYKIMTGIEFDEVPHDFHDMEIS